MFESKGKTSENNLNERTSPSSKGTISTSNLFCQQPVINNANNNNNCIGMGNVSPQNDAVRFVENDFFLNLILICGNLLGSLYH